VSRGPRDPHRTVDLVQGDAKVTMDANTLEAIKEVSFYAMIVLVSWAFFWAASKSNRK